MKSIDDLVPVAVKLSIFSTIIDTWKTNFIINTPHIEKIIDKP